MNKEILNKVAQSGLITLDPEELILPGERLVLDLKFWLFEELLLKEKDFREKVQGHNWKQYKDKFVAITCSSEAIIPMWAFMLIAAALQPYASAFVYGDLQRLEEELLQRKIRSLDPEHFRDQRVVIKGCSTEKFNASSYILLTTFLTPLAKSIMFGEPCSTVPVFKRK
jgi:hypothetical protein